MPTDNREVRGDYCIIGITDEETLSSYIRVNDYKDMGNVTQPLTEDEILEVEGDDDISEEISLVKMIEMYVDATAYSDPIKEKLKSVSTGMYHEMVRILEEKSRNEEI